MACQDDRPLLSLACACRDESRFAKTKNPLHLQRVLKCICISPLLWRGLGEVLFSYYFESNGHFVLFAQADLGCIGTQSFYFTPTRPRLQRGCFTLAFVTSPTQYFLKIAAALCPPKPKVFDRAALVTTLRSPSLDLGIEARLIFLEVFLSFCNQQLLNL
jgi:hypothetical protein